MKKSILESLYNGDLLPFECPNSKVPELKEIQKKIESEEEYLKQKLSTDDCKRLEDLQDLICDSQNINETEIFSHGFAIGAFLMLDAQRIIEKIVK